MNGLHQIVRQLAEFRDFPFVLQLKHIQRFLDSLMDILRLSKAAESLQLKSAAESCFELVAEFQFDLPRYRGILHLRERAEWVILEFQALYGEAPREQLSKYRKNFKIESGGFPRICHLSDEFRYCLRNEGPALNSAHRISSHWADTTGVTLSSRISELNEFMFMLAADLQIATADTWLKRALVRFNNDLDEGIRAKNPEAINLAVEKYQRTLIYGPHGECPQELQLSVGVHSQELMLPAPDGLIERMVEVCNERVIDRNILNPQLGFGRKILVEEIKEALELPGAYLLSLSERNTPFCFYLILTELSKPPEYLKNAIDILSDSGEIDLDRIGWLEYAVTTVEGAKLLKRFNLSGYGLISWVASQIVAAKQIDRLYCTVRAGQLANTARDAHLRHYWQPVGIELSPEMLGSFSSDPAEVLCCDPYSFERTLWYCTNAATHDSGVHLVH